jgi:hypothetical protein
MDLIRGRYRASPYTQIRAITTVQVGGASLNSTEIPAFSCKQPFTNRKASSVSKEEQKKKQKVKMNEFGFHIFQIKVCLLRVEECI